MDPDRWRQITGLFHDVVQQDPHHRPALLDRACGSDLALREQLERLLDAHDRAPDVVGTAAFEYTVQQLTAEAESAAPGRNFGPYRVVAELGRGGMGAVYLAERADDQYEKRVAIKLVKRGMDTEAVLAQFRQERQILASLEHPNIARLLDAGTAEDGVPYFVMEHIDGRPITDYCEEQSLSTTDRLLLFQKVCAAVAYAHQHLVVHRDLKPAHILVTADGAPKLLDFGIAKIMESSEATETRSVVAALRLMTPEYASPEQLQGLPATTLSDVYSLGVVLYELLTGRSPYRVATRSSGDLMQAIIAADPERPSDALHGKHDGDRRRLRGDLDTIVLKAMSKEPARRYQSVERFAEDLERHLAGLPVLARRDTLAYRAAKFVRRRAGLVAAAAVVFVALAAGVAATLWQAERARDAQARAERRFNDVRSLARSVVFDYHAAIKDLPGATPVRARLVRDALLYLDRLASESDDDPSLQRELASAYEHVGDVQGGSMGPNLGDTRGAIASYRNAIQLRESSLLGDRGSFDETRELALTVNKLGLLSWETGDMDGALGHIRRAISLLETLSGTHPTNPDVRRQMARCHDHIGMILQEQGKTTEALDRYRVALAMFEDLSAQDPANPELRRALSTTNEHIGTTLLLTGDLATALERNRRALEIRSALAAEFPTNADLQRIVLVSYYNEGEILAKMGRFREALDKYQLNLVATERWAAADPDNELYRGDIAFGLIRIGDMRTALGDNRQALISYRRSRVLRAADVEKDPANLWKRTSLVDADSKLAKMLAVTGQFSDALEIVKTTSSLMERTPVEPSNASIRSAFADAYADLGQAYVLIASSRGAGRDAKADHWRSARDLYGRSHAILRDLRERGLLTAIDRPRLDAVERQVARCESMVSPANQLPPP
jgi:tetratricopeptide (TPR) repeat protein/tRNA A-37 threonylcarbamoyl transferase component Bud32